MKPIYTYTEVAVRSGLSRSYVGRVMAGKANPTIKTVYRIADALVATLDITLPEAFDMIRNGGK